MITEAEKQLAKLVAMPTLTVDVGANDMALDYIQDYLTARGMYCKQYHFNGHAALLTSTVPDNLFTPAVLLTAHTDVVPAEEELFTLRQDGDKLLGRGAYDMKFAIAGYLQVVDELQDTLADYNFGIMITTDEEETSLSATKLVAMGLKPQVCIMPDSTAPGWDIETVAKGFWRFDVVAKGKSAHGARPWEGESASLKLIHALHELKARFEGHNIDTDTLNIGKIHGGQQYNVVPSEMVAAVEIRYLNKDTLKANQDFINDLCNRHGLVIEKSLICSAVLTDLEHPFVKQYAQSVQAVTGRRPQSFTSCAASDAPAFYDAGITCILSCCSGGGHHTDQEWISRKSFLQFVPILHDYLGRTAKREASALAAQVPSFSLSN